MLLHYYYFNAAWEGERVVVSYVVVLVAHHMHLLTRLHKHHAGRRECSGI